MGFILVVRHELNDYHLEVLLKKEVWLADVGNFLTLLTISLSNFSANTIKP